jgi:hypothetical protein
MSFHSNIRLAVERAGLDWESMYHYTTIARDESYAAGRDTALKTAKEAGYALLALSNDINEWTDIYNVETGEQIDELNT